MNEIPAGLLEGLSLSAMVTARGRWVRLGETECAEIIALCVSEDVVSGLPKVIGGRFVPTDDAAGWDEWQAACFEDLISEPDPAFYEPLYFRTVYIG